jgi:hypothetical protein
MTQVGFFGYYGKGDIVVTTWEGTARQGTAEILETHEGFIDLF